MSAAALIPPAFAGFHGKLPSRGDFVTRRLPRAFLDPWRGWMEAGLGASRQLLGDGWQPFFVTAPAWFFTIDAGLCGPWAAAGVAIPSVDRVGRYFPLAVVAVLAGGAVPPAPEDPWFAAAAEAALAGLDPRCDPDALEARVAALPHPAAGSAGAGGGTTAPGASRWWTAGSARIASVRLDLPGLPAAQSWAALLDGDWDRHGLRAHARPGTADGEAT